MAGVGRRAYGSDDSGAEPEGLAKQAALDRKLREWKRDGETHNCLARH